MSKLFFTFAFAIGIAVASWIGAGFVGSDQLALAFTGVIGAVFCLGFGELVGFRKTTARLSDRLDQPPTDESQLNRWLDGLPEPIQFAVQRRLEGHGAALPGPQLTPYLTGLLVMLGLLGTFAGMIVTLGGAASALDGSTELSAIRGALAAPIAGLSLAFGTSIAGVAASAMLGLASTLSRRDRAQVSRKLDRCLRQKLHHLSADFQRHQAFSALESQANALPAMATAMESMTARMEALGEQLERSLTRNQQEFHNTVGSHYQTLADSVADSLREALTASAQQAADRIEPITANAMEQLQNKAADLHKHWAATTEQQLGELADAFRNTTDQASDRWQKQLEDQLQASAAHQSALEDQSRQSHKDMSELMHRWLADLQDSQQRHQAQSGEQLTAASETLQKANEQAQARWQTAIEQQQNAGASLLESVSQTLSAHQSQFQADTAALIRQQESGLEELIAGIQRQLSDLRTQEASRGEAASERLEALEATVARHLTELGTALEAPMTRLIETASETPKAAAEVIKQLQSEIARNSERENELLEERKRLVQELDGLLAAQRTNAEGQRQAVDTLVSGASEILGGISERFNTLIQEQSERLGRLGEDLTGSSQEVGALSEAFQTAVEQFSNSNTRLQESLSEIQKAMDNASTRHDEQLAYYVAQAREVIDLTVSSQKDVMDAAAALRQAKPETSEAD
ncbi:putative membrane protein [Marinobacter nitratireducens]|uniref:Putative membrane protein n=1 Tax=Marinobacter nitratireducens TaxID=1137280 RepID=A0A072N300_9GAMM|nr:membrane protein [Marinobacter nitratireducens]KEF31876.1 putative membrane protein [Marinobacter nitratireducens]